MPVVLYGCETWSVALRTEHKLREFKNCVLREIFGSKIEEVTGYWRELRNEELHALYSSPNIVRLVRLRRGDGLGMWHVWGETNAFRDLVGKTEGKRVLGRPKHRWEFI